MFSSEQVISCFTSEISASGVTVRETAVSVPDPLTLICERESTKGVRRLEVGLARALTLLAKLLWMPSHDFLDIGPCAYRDLAHRPTLFLCQGGPLLRLCCQHHTQAGDSVM
jgi:hypothetical protein